MNAHLGRWNTLPPEQAEQEILPCCGSRAWAREIAALRPFEDIASLLATSDRIWRGLPVSDWTEAFHTHPRIGETPSQAESPARSALWSRQEQSSAAEGLDSVKLALAAGNREYEKKFGRIFIICATGKTAAEILGHLQRRLHNDEASELQQKSFLECGAAQCGICTPGMILAAIHLLGTTPQPNLEQIREGLSGNLCRCTGYLQIFDAVAKAAGSERQP